MKKVGIWSVVGVFALSGALVFADSLLSSKIAGSSYSRFSWKSLARVYDLPDTLEIATETLPAGMEMLPYLATLEATNGVPPYEWSVPPVVSWGGWLGERDVPVGLTGVVAIAAGRYHSLALNTNGTVAAWGDGWGMTDSTGVVAIAAGGEHSLALKTNGTVVAWGANWYGQTDVPVGLTGVVAIAAGDFHSMALKSNGTVVSWGGNAYGQTDVPVGLTGVVAIAAGGAHSLTLKTNGMVVAWGYNGWGQTDVPVGLTGVLAVAAGVSHSMALKSNGTVVAWGGNASGQTDVPVGLTGVVAIAAGGDHSLALKTDGTVVAWGDNDSGQTDVPLGLTGVVAIAAGGFHSLALKADSALLPEGLSLSVDGVVSGIPTTAGTSVVNFVVTDSLGATTNKLLEIAVAPNPNPWLAIAPADTNMFSTTSSGHRIAVAANVPWAATNNVPWISIASGAAGTNNGAVTFGVAANAGPAARAGSITVVGGGIMRTCTVIQAGCPLVDAEFFRVGGGLAVNLSIVGAPNARYVLQTSTNLLDPTGWISIATNVADDFGVWEGAGTNLNARNQYFRISTTPQ